MKTILEEILKMEKEGIDVTRIKQMTLDLIVKSDNTLSNKKTNTLQLQKLILAYLKKMDDHRPVLKTVKLDTNGYWFTNGYTLFNLFSAMKIEGLPLWNDSMQQEYINTSGYFEGIDNRSNEKIDMVLLNQKVELMKSIKKLNKTKIDKVALNDDTCYQLHGKYFNPMLLLEAVKILGGEVSDIHFKSDSPVEGITLFGNNGKCLILPIRKNW